MIEMNCPACGAEGRVPSEKVNTRLVCRKCLKVFHLTPSGRAVLGEPGPDPAAAAHSKDSALDPTLEVDQWLDRLAKRLTSPATLAIAAGLILLLAILSFTSLRKSETLEDRVSKVATAAFQGDLQTIRELAATGTSEDAVKWYGAIRTQCDEFRQKLGSRRLKVDVTIKHQDSEQAPAEVVAVLDSDDQLERRGSSLPDPLSTVSTSVEHTLSLPMWWRTEGWSGWRLDGKRTLELAELTGSGP